MELFGRQLAAEVLEDGVEEPPYRRLPSPPYRIACRHMAEPDYEDGLGAADVRGEMRGDLLQHLQSRAVGT